MARPRNSAYRRDVLWIAAMIHRISGLLLALFLPLHFLALGLALEGAARLDGFLKWTDSGLVKIAEMGLVFLLAVHLLGGLRVLIIENMPWREGQKNIAIIAGAVAAVMALVFIARAI